MFVQAELEDTKIIDTKAAELPASAKGECLAGVKIKNGPLAKKVLELRKPFNTIGFNGMKMAMISRNANNYTISILKTTKLRRESDVPKVNNKPITVEARKLNEHDIIELAGTQMEFFYFH